jgi:hypothetical protein
MQLARWLLLLGFLLLVRGQDEEGGEEAAPAEEGEAPSEATEDEAAPAAEDGSDAAPAADGEAPAAEGEDGGGGSEESSLQTDGDEECEVEETEGEKTGDDISDILAIGGEDKKCKKKDTKEDAAAEEGSSSGEEPSGADALAEAVGAATCDKDGMDEKVAKCLGGLETKVGELMTAILGPDGGGGSLEDTITLVLVKKGVISCENETQCDDNKQCLAQPDGMSRCQNPCERPEIIRQAT